MNSLISAAMRRGKTMKKTRLRVAPALVGVIASVVVLGAGPALGAQLSACTTISQRGSYELTRNLTARGDCLVVAANFVTIDLGGWVIAGNGTGSGITDQEAARRGIAVRNGTVTNFDAGVALGETTGAVVENVRAITHNTFGIATGSFSIVSGNIVENTIFGIIAGRFSTVTGNSAAGGEGGIRAGPHSTVSGNSVFGDPGIGAGPGSTISGNTVQGLAGIETGPGSTVSGNTVQNTGGGTGITVACPSNVIENTVTGHEENLLLVGAGCTNIDNLAP